MFRAVTWTLLLSAFNVAVFVRGCGFPGAPAHSSVTFSTHDGGAGDDSGAGVADESDAQAAGTVAVYSCERGFELLGPARRRCHSNGTWTPDGIPFCVINVAAGKAPMQSSTAQGGVPQKAVDGSTSSRFDPSTCTLTEQETAPLWYVNLLEPYMVQLVRLDFGRSCCGTNQPATVVVRVGNNRPDLKINPICNRFTGYLREGRPLFLPCNPPMPGAFVSVHLEAPAGQMLSICEAFVYTDQALPMERCPQFRDQRPGSTATYNGRCYTFYNGQPTDFDSAQRYCETRGGSLISQTNPALQGFLSWELWRRHRDDPGGQYWNGAVRDPSDPGSWRWVNGEPVGVSFWSLPGGTENCARFDGTKDWLWADTDCRRNLHFICQHQPIACGRPEQPANSSLILAADQQFVVGTHVQYSCAAGHLLVGPEQRQCLDTGYYSGYAPTCQQLECGSPARIVRGSYRLLNNSFTYGSLVEYSCDQGHVLEGRKRLLCDIDQRWNGPPPQCQPESCGTPPAVLNGQYSLSTNTTVVGTLVTYSCRDQQLQLVGAEQLRCLANGSYDQPAPVCRAATAAGDEPNVSFGRPEENEIPDTVNIRQNLLPDINEPKNTLDERVRSSRLNMGGIIALGVFGGFVFLAAVITSVIIIARRHTTGEVGGYTSRQHYHDKQHQQRGGGGRSRSAHLEEGRGSMMARGSRYSSGSDAAAHALNKYYRRAWDNLQRHDAAGSNVAVTSDDQASVSGDRHSGGGGDDGGSGQRSRGHHHHHHHHRSHHRHHHHRHHTTSRPRQG